MSHSVFHANPFPGIRSYEIRESHLFFGREQQVRELIDKLTDTRFLAIVGSSGCGKSSLIKAGLIPRLSETLSGGVPAGWKHLVFRPADDPIGNLASALAEIQPDRIRSEEILRKNSNGLTELIREGWKGNQSILLVVDQFEELFRFKYNRTSFRTILEANQFITLLISTVRQTELPVYVVLSMRTDFLDDCTEFRGLSELINEGYYLVPRMNHEERKLAITGPVQVAGSSVTDELLTRLLEDTGDDPDHLPILQHAMMRTWDHYLLNKTGDQPIGLEHYQAIGSMSEALSYHLEELYADLKDPKIQYQAEKMFKALTEISGERRGTRRPTQLSEICTLAGAREEEMIRIVDHFRKPGCTFLMPPAEYTLNADSTIDISHESIMRVWTRLRKWVEEESNSAQLYLRLSKSAELYQEGKTGLWIDPDLQLALQWKETTKPNATWAQRYDPAYERAMNFLEFSRKQHDLELFNKENQQKRNLRRARISAMVLGAASLVSILFLIISLNLRFKAEASRKEALEKEKLAVAERKRTDEQRKEAIVQKKIAEQQQQIAEQQEMITEQQRQYAVRQQLIAQEQTQVAIQQRKQADIAKQDAILARDEAQSQRREAVSQKQIAEQERTKAEESEQKARRLGLLAVSRSTAIQASQLHSTVMDDLPALLALTAYQFNGENGGNENDPAIYKALSDVSGDQKILRGHEDAIRSMIVSANGKYLYSCGDDHKVVRWDLSQASSSPVFAQIPKQSAGGFRAISLTSDERWLLAGDTRGLILAWSRDDLTKPPVVLKGHQDIVNRIVADPSGKGFFTCGADGKLFRWDIDGDRFSRNLLDSVPGNIQAMAIRADGNRIIYTTGTGAVRELNPGSISPGVKLIRTLAVPALSLAFSHSGEWIAMGCRDGSIQIISAADPAGKSQTVLGRHVSGVTALAFSSDDHWLVSSGYDWSVKMACFPVTEDNPIAIDRCELWIYDVGFTPDGTQIIAGSADKTIRIFSARSRDMADRIRRTIKRNMTREEWTRMVGDNIPYRKTIENLP